MNQGTFELEAFALPDALAVEGRPRPPSQAIVSSGRYTVFII